MNRLVRPVAFIAEDSGGVCSAEGSEKRGPSLAMRPVTQDTTAFGLRRLAQHRPLPVLAWTEKIFVPTRIINRIFAEARDVA
jgi:hypothetical protein